MAKEKVNLSSPWVIYYRKLESFFELDPDVEVILEEEYQPVIRLYVDNARKAVMFYEDNKDYSDEIDELKDAVRAITSILKLEFDSNQQFQLFVTFPLAF